ncbi:MAG: LemA family protein [Campylobacter sp.]|nr:LemA family protein [Campylobacter sp.]
MNGLWIIFGVIAVVLLYAISIYNALIAKRNQVASIEAGVDTQLKRRYDLLPNLIATAKQYLSQEKELVERVTELRAQA